MFFVVVHCRLLSFVVVCCIVVCCHSFSFVVVRCRSLSFVVFSLSFIVIQVRVRVRVRIRVRVRRVLPDAFPTSRRLVQTYVLKEKRLVQNLHTEYYFVYCALG